MIAQWPQLIDQQFCFECRGCCSFNEPKSPWRARLTKEEQSRYAQKEAQRFRQDGFFLDTVDQHGAHLCCFLDPTDHSCRVYAQRPLECALYPFLIMRRKNQLCLAVHLACPFVQSHHKTAEFLRAQKVMKKILLRKRWKNFLDSQRDAFQDLDFFRSEVDLMFYL